MEKAIELAPRDIALHFNSIQSFAAWRYDLPPPEYVSPELTWSVPDELNDWVNTYILKSHVRPKSLVLFGDTRLGKTLWARSLGRHLYFPGLFMLAGTNTADNGYAIFDDLIHGISTLPDYKAWLGGQREIVCTDKYKKKERLTWGKPSIFISNTDPRFDSGVDVEWLTGNCVFVRVTTPLSPDLIVD
jgi:hypothetical protein